MLKVATCEPDMTHIHDLFGSQRMEKWANFKSGDFLRLVDFHFLKLEVATLGLYSSITKIGGDCSF